MKKLKLLILVSVLSFTLFLFGCTKATESPKQEINYCAKCGDIANNVVSGSKFSMEQQGIPLSKCRSVTSTVYSAYLCDNCLGPVVSW